MNLYDLSEIKIMDIKPEKYEAKFSVTQLFVTGIEVTLYWVIRNNKIYYYDVREIKHP